MFYYFPWTWLILIGLVIAVVRLNARVGVLERRMKEGGARSSSLNDSDSAPAMSASIRTNSSLPAQPAPTVATPAYAPAALPSQNSNGPTLGERFSEWLKEDWLLKVGAFILFLGFAWLLTYAFMNGWIGPAGQITIGLVAGALMMVFGFTRMGRYPTQGSTFLVLGSGVVILTIFAARNVYDFFNPTSALVLMFLSAAFVALASVKYRLSSLSLISVLLAGITPLLIGSTSQDYVALFTYLFVVVLGTVWVVSVTGWRTLLFAALIIVSLYSAGPWTFAARGDAQSTLLLFAYAFTALFFVVGTLGTLKSVGNELLADLLLAAGNGIFLLLWVMTSAPRDWQSLIIAAWMLVFAVGGFVVFRVTRKTTPFLLYAGVAVVMLAAATALELEGAALIIAYIIEAAMLPLVTYGLIKDLQIVERSALVFIVPMALSMASIYRAGEGAVFNLDAIVLLVLSTALLAVGGFIYSRRSEAVAKLGVYKVLLVAGVAYVYILIWQVLHAGMDGYPPTIIALIIYTLIGLVTHFYGKFMQARGIMLHGSVLLGAVATRLLIYDVWFMPTAGKIIVFFVVGGLFMMTSFVGRASKNPTTPIN